MAIREFSKPSGVVPAVVDGATFVSERLGFVYYCVPKTLSRSMLQYLAAVDPNGYRIVEKTGWLEIATGVAATNAPTSFTFVRNPYSRVVAFYYDKFVNYLDTPGQRALFGRYERLRPDMTLSEFVDWLGSGEGSDERADAHFLSQHYFLLDVNGAPAVDYLGKVESVEEDLAELQKLLGLRRSPASIRTRPEKECGSIRRSAGSRFSTTVPSASSRAGMTVTSSSSRTLGFRTRRFPSIHDAEARRVMRTRMWGSPTVHRCVGAGPL